MMKKKLPMNRRRFIETGLQAAAVLATAHRSRSAPAENWHPPKRLITITYNVYAYRGYPKTDDTQPLLEQTRGQMPERMALELGIHRPDIVTFQESPPEADVKRTAEHMGLKHVYFPGGFPGALLTRFEIVSAQNCPLVTRSERGDLFSRHWGKALLRVNGRGLMVYSVHLHPSNDEIRSREIDEILKVIHTDSAGMGNDYILQGDLNHEPIQAEYSRWKGAGLTDCYAEKGVEQPNTIKSTFPNRTVDYIWAGPEYTNRLIRCRVLFVGAFRTNPLDERSYALSDHLPVLAEFVSP